MSTATADQIDALLPQTQCTKCGYAGCRPYAEAIAAGQADLNQCPPGGEAAIRKLATLLGRLPKPLDPANGVQGPRAAALIDESRCIGCTLCIQACPTDAIVGAPKQMHTVITAQCTGCELCLPPCPVDCIEILTLEALGRRGSQTARLETVVPVAAHSSRWRERYQWHRDRLEREREQREHRPQAQAQERLAARTVIATGHDVERKRAAIRAAIERARARAAAGPA